MSKESVIKTLKKEGEVETIDVPVISIDPALSLYELLEKIYEAEKQKHTTLLNITFEGCIQADNPTKKAYGKYGRLKIKYIDGTNVPKKTIYFSDDYTTIDLIEAFDELEKDLLKESYKYSMDIYPIKLFILDRGSISNKSLTVVQFNKERKINKQSEVGKMLSGQQVMPLDAVMVYSASLDKRTGKYKYGKKTIPKGIAEEKKQYEQGKFVLNVDHVERYTRHVCHASFTGIRTCKVGRTIETVAKYEAIDGISKCEWIPNPEVVFEEENLDNE